MKLDDWNAKQDAVDDLFESTEAALKEEHDVIGRHPKFGDYVETALEEYLKELIEVEEGDAASASDKKKDAKPVDKKETEETKPLDMTDPKQWPPPTPLSKEQLEVTDQAAIPIFFEFSQKESEEASPFVPSI